MRDALAALGPYFDVGPPDVSPEAPWRPLADLLATPEPLAQRASAIGDALGGSAVERRTAVSVAHLGLVARLVSPVIGAALLDGRVLELEPAQVWWQPQLGGAMPLLLGDPVLAGLPYGGPVALAVGEFVASGATARLVELAASMSVSRRVLWGNVASAVNGAVTMAARARPDLARQAVSLGQGLLGQPVLSATSTGVVASDFRRRSCCLLYRVAPSGPGTAKALCGDCVLMPAQ